MKFKINKIAAGIALAGSVSALSAMPMVSYADESLSLEEVTVTARKKVESLQDIAVSVTSITAQLENSAVRSIQDIQNYVPNVNIDFGIASGGGAVISIRGLSQQDPDKSIDSPVGVILDGVAMGTTAGQMLDNFDLASVEVLRGPQGTLFGKNTTAGALNIKRSAPTGEYGAKIKAGLGDFGAKDIKAVVNMPLADNGGVKLFANKSESDGFIYNTTTERDAGGTDYQQLGVAVSYDVTDNFDVLFSFDRINDDSERGAWANFNTFSDVACLVTLGGVPGVIQPSLGALGTSGAGCMDLDSGSSNDTVSQNMHNESSTNSDFASLNMNWALGEWALTSVTGYQDRDESYVAEWDASQSEFLHVFGAHQYKQLSQELRINGDLTQALNLTAGLYYFDSEFTQSQTSHNLMHHLAPAFLGLVPGDVTQSLTGTGTVETTAVFASVDWNLTEDLLLNLGGRYTVDKKSHSAPNAWFNSELGNPFFSGEEGEAFNVADEWKEFTPRVALQYNVNDDLMAFASYAEGFKSGGFFARGTQSEELQAFDPEYVATYELGLKSEWMDGRVRFNATAFLSDYTDKQEDTLVSDGTGADTTVLSIVTNAGNATIKGLELEMQAQLTTGLSMYMMAGLTDAKYDEFTADIDGGDVEEPTDNTYLKFRNAPEKTFGLGLDYVHSVSFGELAANYSYRWSDEYETDFFNDSMGRVESMGIHNLSLSANIDDKYTVSLYGRNLTDERYARYVTFASLVGIGQWNAPRNIGVEFIADF